MTSEPCPSPRSPASPRGEAPLAPRLSTLLAVSLVSAAVLLLEIALTKFFSFRLWYHFGFMIISIAMLGASASGSLLALASPRLARLDPRRLAPVLALLFGVSILAALWVAAVLIDPMGEHRAKTYLAKFFFFARYWAVLAWPFVFGGAAVSWTLRTYRAEVHRLYAFDLVGGAAGCLLTVVLFDALLAEHAVAAAAGLAFLACMLFAAGVPRFPRGIVACAGIGVLAAMAVALGPWRFPVRITAKGLGLALHERRGRIVATATGITGRVDVLDGEMERFGWAMKHTYQGHFPAQRSMYIDGDALTMITRFDGDPAAWAFTDVMLSTLPHVLAKERPRAAPPGGRKVLVIGPGGGMDVVNAVVHGATEVWAVEVNQAVVDLMQGPFRDFSGGIYAGHPAVRVVVCDGRNFVERSGDRYDLIQLTMVDTTAAIASGAMALSEDYLYTTEGFRAYLRRLRPDGMLSLVRLSQEAMGLVSLLWAATADAGIDVRRHLFVVEVPAQYGGLCVCYQASPLTAAQTEEASRWARENGFVRVYPDPPAGSATGSEIARFLDAPDKAAFIAASARDVEPETDDRPFYFRHSKWSEVFEYYTGGKGTLLVILEVAFVYGIVFLFLPLWLRGKGLSSAQGRGWLRFFLLIGVAFITVEIVLMQILSLYLGHPAYSIAATLFALLAFCGLGSGISRRLAGERPARPLGGVLVGIAALALAYAFGLHPLLGWFMGAGLWVRLGLAVAAVAPLGVLMGMPFPLGMAAIASVHEDGPLWAWAANGFGSVVGTSLAMVLAHLVGFRLTLVCGAVAYLLALLSAPSSSS